MKKKTMFDKFGLTFCEKCLKICNVEEHHLVFRSEAVNHRNLNHEDNILCCCRQDHDKLHQNKKERNEIVKKRKLWEIFPELLYLKNL
jgi:hypothetical protein